MNKIPPEIAALPLPDGMQWYNNGDLLGINKKDPKHWWFWWYRFNDYGSGKGWVGCHEPKHEQKDGVAFFGDDVFGAAQYMSVRALLGSYE